MTEQLEPIKGKSFWKRPEGKLGAFVLIAGVAVVAIFHQPIFAFVTSLLAGTISTIALVAVAAALLYIVLVIG